MSTFLTVNRRNAIGGGLALAAIAAVSPGQSGRGPSASNPVHLIARYRALSGKEAEVRSLLSGFIAPTRKQAGNLYYDLYQAKPNNGEFYFVEGWASQEAFDAHVANGFVQQTLTVLKPLLAGPADLIFCNRLS